MYYNNNRSNFFNLQSAVGQLILLNVILFSLTNLLPQLNLIEHLSLFYPSSPYFRVYQLITHLFMHASFTHIFFNMFNLWMFGSRLESIWGRDRFLIYYFITGLGAVFFHLFTQGIIIYNATSSFFPHEFLLKNLEGTNQLINTPTLGASGAVYGLLLAYGYLFANSELYIYGLFPLKAKYLVGFMIIGEVYLGIVNHPGDNVAHFAHLGGALIGYIILKIWSKNRNYLY